MAGLFFGFVFFDRKRLGKRFFFLFRSYIALPSHLSEHKISSCLGSLGISERIVIIRRFRHCGEGGAFRKIELFDIFIKIYPGRRLRSVSSATEIYLVDVKLQNFVF